LTDPVHRWPPLGRIVHGRETWWQPSYWYKHVKLAPSCLVCSTGIGYFHQLDCTLEECPVHRGRRLADHDHDERAEP
jgi:hypothetical protein